MKKYLQRLGIVILSIFLLGSNYPVRAASGSVKIQILAVNDFHGALDTTGSVTINGNRLGYAGRASVLSAYLNQAESDFLDENPNGTSVRVQSGDMVGASPAVSGLLQDEPTIKVLKEMKFTIGTLGNHEFDEGLEEYHRILSGLAPKPGEFNEIVDNYDREPSGQKIVIANLVDKQGKIPFGWEPYTIETYKNEFDEEVKVAYIGVVTTEIPNLVLKKYHENYVVSSEAEAIAKYSRELQEVHGVKAIVVLAHCPTVTDESGNVYGDVAQIIDETKEIYPESSLDLVIAGHNHVYANGIHNGVRVVQSISQGKAFSNVTGSLDPNTKDFVDIVDAVVTPTLVDENNLPVNGLTIDSTVQGIVDQAATIIKPIADATISKADLSVVEENMISRSVNARNESPVGNLITDGQLYIARKTFPEVDFAMTNNGGIRADLLVANDGSISWGAAQAVQPFGNILQVVEMTGEKVVEALNQQYDENQKYFLQISGLRYTYITSDDPNYVYKVKDVYKENGEQLDLNATYQVIINDFLYGGGDGFSAFVGTKNLGAIDPDTETFIQYLKDLYAQNILVSAKIEGRKLYDSNVDKTKLDELISKTRVLDLTQYTDETRLILEQALETAIAESESIESTEESVLLAYNNLSDAYNQLVEKITEWILTDEKTKVKVVLDSSMFDAKPSLVVEKVDYQIDGYLSEAYDISFRVANEIVQPNGDVEVYLPLGTFKANQVKVFHVSENGLDELDITSFGTEEVIFKSSSFSTFVLAQKDSKIPNTGVGNDVTQIGFGIMALGFSSLAVAYFSRRKRKK